MNAPRRTSPNRTGSGTAASLLLACLLVSGGCASHPGVDVRRTESTLELGVPEGAVATYVLRPPADSGLPLEAAGYFHPLRSPSGDVVTDFVPSDHRHHRGLFLAWVEMHGAKDADFWGWGQHAPIRGRRIVNRDATATPDGFVSHNDWMADDAVVLRETLTTRVSRQEGLNVLDLEYRFVPESDLTLSRWAFSGFCLRVRKDGDLRISDRKGVVGLPNPSHVEPSSDWPDAPWYAAEQTLSNGHQIGAVVFNHPGNPPTLWHNHRDVRMINPCIVAPSSVRLAAGRPLTLRYRVATFDGPLPKAAVERLMPR